MIIAPHILPLFEPVAPQTVPTVAHELVAMFRDPKTIRQVVLLREVLDRPIDRW